MTVVPVHYIFVVIMHSVFKITSCSLNVTYKIILDTSTTLIKLSADENFQFCIDRIHFTSLQLIAEPLFETVPYCLFPLLQVVGFAGLETKGHRRIIQYRVPQLK